MEISAISADSQGFHVLIVAAGQGLRFGGDLPKQYMRLCGAPILRHTLDAFRVLPETLSITVAISPDHMALYKDAVSSLDLPPPVHGGADRMTTVANGLKALSHLKPEDVILIHDAARPFIGRSDILQLADAALTHGAASLAYPVTDALRRDDGHYVDRNGLWALQTPQGFHYGLIAKAHQQRTGDFPDDTGLVASLGHDVKIVPGNRRNFKITTPEDWAYAEQMMQAAMETRIGMGFDVHAFDKNKPGSVRLCGIDIPHDYGLEGHSDADLGLHALTDALLGAMAEGDIGRHFPSSDPRWKNADSAVFLKHAVDILNKKGARIVNLDLTLICEAPKISAHVDRMRDNVAAICGIPSSRISIKGTTAQKLGFTGRREGIAAQAIANVEAPRV